MVIRPAEQRDIPALIRLLYQVGEVHHQIRPDIFRSSALKYTASELETILTDSTRPIFVAAEDDVLGYCFCKIRCTSGSTVLADRKELYIDDLCIEEACRGQHVGKALYDHACEYARSIGCEYITLNVWCGNDSAMAFYQHRGLTPRNIMMERKL